ncbi:hypothetical protein AAF712_006042 [Marasmius tenuissimus]|uniref:Uncharacterized protein n=1 Tax=Marasmius tenuissimus TaxID=585030 RepID=A0ABR3A0I6_9AGAR
MVWCHNAHDSGKACNMTVITGTHAVSPYPYSTHHLEEGVINCINRPIPPPILPLLDVYRDMGYSQFYSPQPAAVLKQNTEFARHRALGDSASWIFQLDSSGISNDDLSRGLEALSKMKAVSWSSVMNVRNVFGLDFEERMNCNWSTAYPMADSCRGLAAHSSIGNVCARCADRSCRE